MPGGISSGVPYNGAADNVDLGSHSLVTTSIVIGANTLDTNEFAFLDGQDQSVKTTSNPQFNPTLTGASGIACALQLNPTISQSGTAGYTGLFINITTSTTGSGAKKFMEFQAGGSTKLALYADGTFQASNIYNLSSIAYASVLMTNTGVQIERNVADANPSLIVNQKHASSTGDIADFQKGGTTKAKVDVDGKIGVNCTQTTVNGSTLGSAVFSMPFNGTAYKKVVVYCNALDGTAGYTFPTAFAQTPIVLVTTADLSARVTSLSTTGCTLTGLPSTGIIVIEGW